MLSLKDCIDMCGLTEDEVAAIAEEANLPPIVAVLVGSNLLRSEAGLRYFGEVLRNHTKNTINHNQPNITTHYHTTYKNFQQHYPQPLIN